MGSISLGQYWDAIVIAPADVVKNNNTTPAATGLTIALPANTSWMFEMLLVVSQEAGSAQEDEITLSGPAGATAQWGEKDLAGADTLKGPTSTNFGRVSIGATAGSFAVLFAQETAEAKNHTFHAGSTLFMKRIT